MTAFASRTLFASLLLTLAFDLRADDWPQWLGPRRDGFLRETNLLNQFPATGPKVRWRVPVRGGYAGAAVAQGKVFVTDYQQSPGTAAPKDAWDRKVRQGTERVLCFNEADGKLLWSHEYEVNYGISYGAGPRTTPVIENDRVYALGAEGHLLCLDLATGKPVWQKHVRTDVHKDAPTPTWGYAGHPIIDGDKLIALTAGNAATAFNKKTGDVLWSALPVKDPGYAPPMIYNLAGTRTLIIWHPTAVNGLNPETGELLWTRPLGPVQNGVSITTPLVETSLQSKPEDHHERLFLTSAYTGGLMLKFTQGKREPETQWHQVRREGARKGDALHTLMAAPVFTHGHIYGVDFRGELVCIDSATGARKWESLLPAYNDASAEPRNWATVFITPTTEPDQYFLANDQGEFILAKLTPTGYTEISRTRLLEPTNRDANTPVLWCAPAYSNKSMFWRNDKELICVSLAKEGN